MSLRSASNSRRPAQVTCNARHACPSAHACTSAWRSVSSTCSTSEPGSTRSLPTSKMRTERTNPLPLAAEEPTSTFSQPAVLPTAEKQAASCGSQWEVSSPRRTASLSSGESLATSKNAFWTDSRYFRSELPPLVSLTKGKTQSDLSLSASASSVGADSAGGMGSTSSCFCAAEAAADARKASTNTNRICLP